MKDDKQAEIGQKLKILRLKAKKKQQDIADALSVSSSYLCQLEAGRREWTEELIQKYKAALA